MFVLLFSIGIAWASLRAWEQMRGEVATATAPARARARAGRAKRAEQIRKRGWKHPSRWALAAGVGTVRTGRGTARAVRATPHVVRTTVRVGRAGVRGWRAGWAEGKQRGQQRHDAYVARRQERKTAKAEAKQAKAPAAAPAAPKPPTAEPTRPTGDEPRKQDGADTTRIADAIRAGRRSGPADGDGEGDWRIPPPVQPKPSGDECADGHTPGRVSSSEPRGDGSVVLHTVCARCGTELHRVKGFGRSTPRGPADKVDEEDYTRSPWVPKSEDTPASEPDVTTRPSEDLSTAEHAGWQIRGRTGDPWETIATADATDWQNRPVTVTTVDGKTADIKAGQQVQIRPAPADPAADQRAGTATREDTAVSTATASGEAPNIVAARDNLQAVVEQCQQTETVIDNLTGSLTSNDMDPETLREVAAIQDSASNMRAQAQTALNGLESRHRQMEEAVNSTQHAAKTQFYRH